MLIPTGWFSLSQNPDWMKIIFDMLSDPFIDSSHVPVLFAVRINRFKVLSYDRITGSAVIQGKNVYQISAEELAPVDCSLRWLLDIPDFPVRLLPIYGRDVREADLSDVSFQEYLTLENLYQGFLQKKDDSLLRRMGNILYPRRRPFVRKLDRKYIFSCFFWMASFKIWASKRWPNFLKPAADKVSLANPASFLREAVDAQIRALTKGDISKEKQILELSCHRALTELDALARESEEYRKKMKK